jgi:predicted nucleic acid-binding protein
MTRFGIDALTAVRLVREGVVVSEEHQLVAPNLLRSQALSIIYRSVLDGSTSAPDARLQLDRITTMRVRLLGDRVSRGTAWKVASALDWDDTANAEYVAVAQLQADAFVTGDAELARAVAAIVTLAPYEALLR